MASLRAAYGHIGRTRRTDQKALYALWTCLMVGMTMLQSWFIGTVAALIWVVGIPLFVYNQEHVTRRSCRRDDGRQVPAKGIARTATG